MKNLFWTGMGIVCMLLVVTSISLLPKKPTPQKIAKVIPTSTPTPTPTIPPKLRIPVITYHYIEYVKNTKDITRQKLNTNPDLFESELKQLQKDNYITYFVKDIPYLFKHATSLPDKRIVLTFDDGYKDFYLNAYPLLEKYHMKATIFIIANFIGRPDYMSKSDLDELAQSNLIEIGAHTMNHPDLRHIPLAKARAEIFDSKKILSDEFHINIQTFAYPGGAYNDDVVNMVKDASFEAAVTTNPGTYITYNQMYLIPRLRPGFLSNRIVDSVFSLLKL